MPLSHREALNRPLTMEVEVLVTQLYPTLYDPVNCSPPGSSVHGILQALILEWVAMPSSRGSSQPRDQTASLPSPALAGGFFTTELPGKPKRMFSLLCLVAQSCMTFCDPMDCSLPGSSLHGDFPGKNIGLSCHAPSGRSS